MQQSCKVCSIVGFDPQKVLKQSKKPKLIKQRLAKRSTNQLLQSYNLGYLLFECLKCHVQVHQHCCNQDFPSPKQDETEYVNLAKSLEWMCDYCAEEKIGECLICEQQYQKELMRTSEMHLYCAFWFNEVEIIEGQSRASGLQCIEKYKSGTCSLCKQDSGCKVKCAMQSCSECFHPICAKESGQNHIVLETAMRVIFCKMHSTPFQ